MRLFCGGAGLEVGRSHFVIEENNIRIGLDAGIKILEDRGIEYPITQEGMKFLILTHAHMDHSGYVPALPSSVPIYMTEPTLLASEHMWIDAIKVARKRNRTPDYTMKDIKRVIKDVETVGYGEWNADYGVRFRMLRAGHLLGAAMVYMEIGKRRILYTGDFKYVDTELIRRAEPPPQVDTLIIESTYWYQNHPDRRSQIERIYEVVDRTIERGGVALFPAFSLGRTQDLISILVDRYKNRVPIYVDGLGKKINQVYRSFRDELIDRRFVNKLEEIEEVDGMKRRSRIVDQPGIIISSSGMLEGGPALYYIFHLNKNSSIILTGYQIRGSNGYRLINYNKIKMNDVELRVDLPVYHISISAHGDRKDIIEFIQRASPERVVLVHSDSTNIFQEELRTEHGYEVLSPKTGEWLDL